MSSARSRNVLRNLAQLPWWVSVAVAAMAFAGLRWLAPALTINSRLLAPLGQAAASHAWIAFVFLLPIPFALIGASKRHRLVEGPADIDRLRSMPWQDFEQLVAEAYRRKEYRVVVRGQTTGDGGIDLELRTKDKKLVVQCKRWKSRTVGVELVRELYGAMVGEEAHSAIFVTSGRYTADAIEFARDKPIKLMDGAGLVELLKVVQAASTDARRAPTETPVITTAEGPITCPQCGGAMVRRVAKHGANAGSAFWGCSRFPACRGTRAVAA